MGNPSAEASHQRIDRRARWLCVLPDACGIVEVSSGVQKWPWVDGALGYTTHGKIGMCCVWAVGWLMVGVDESGKGRRGEK